MRKSHAYGDSNCHIHSDRNADRDSYIYAYRNGNTDGNIHANGYGNCHRHSYSNRDGYCDCKPAAYAHATASAYTAASSLALFGIRGTRETKLVSSQLQSCSKSLTNAGRPLYKGVGLHLEVS
jgi:hypothetical protein